jgi:hypothetical protein
MTAKTIRRPVGEAASLKADQVFRAICSLADLQNSPQNIEDLKNEKFVGV